MADGRFEVTAADGRMLEGVAGGAETGPLVLRHHPLGEESCAGERMRTAAGAAGRQELLGAELRGDGGGVGSAVAHGPAGDPPRTARARPRILAEP